jgi:two-component system chemotaxis response regulator CheY
MANEFSYSFDRFSILVVEDNGDMKMLLSSVLKDLGIGRVEAASDGGEAVEFLKLVATDPLRAGIQMLDMIVSNWQMAPMDGLELLRWVRRNKESPDRFIPFVLVTSFADLSRFKQARDAGVTEFMAKPYKLQRCAIGFSPSSNGRASMSRPLSFSAQIDAAARMRSRASNAGLSTRRKMSSTRQSLRNGG